MVWTGGDPASFVTSDGGEAASYFMPEFQARLGDRRLVSGRGLLPCFCAPKLLSWAPSMKVKSLALLFFMFLAFKASGQNTSASHVEFHLTFSRFLPPWPPLPHARGYYRATFSLDDHILSYEMELPTRLGGEWEARISEPNKMHAGGRLVFDLGTCRPDPPSNGGPPPPHNPGTCYIYGTLALTPKQTKDLLLGDWVLEANLDGSFYSPLVASEAILPDDSDGDGVPDFRDDCPETAAGEKVNDHGCSVEQLRGRGVE